MFNYYYARTIYGLITGFVDMFNSIEVVRFDDDFNPVKSVHVPISFGPMSKYYMNSLENAQKDSAGRYYQQLPAMAVNITSLTPSFNESTGSYEVRNFNTPIVNNKQLKDVNPSPVDINFQLTIRTESMEDWCQIIEQILPYFNPNLHIITKEFPMVTVLQDSNLMGIERDINIILNSSSPPEYITEQDPESGPRYVNSTIDFTAKAFFYKELKMVNSPVISTIKNYYELPLDSVTNKRRMDWEGTVFQYTQGESIVEDFNDIRNNISAIEKIPQDNITSSEFLSLYLKDIIGNNN